MSHDSEIFKNEIQLAEDECCVVFDFGCYFPYPNTDELTFNFSLGTEEFSDYKLNHRYPNSGYQTISKKYGRKVSKIGYPYVFKLQEQLPMLLNLRIGNRDNYVTLIFRIQTRMTKDKPICILALHYILDKSEFRFMSYEKAEDGGHYQHIWRNRERENKANSDNGTLLSAPRIVDRGSQTLAYDDIIEPYPLSLHDVEIF